MTLADILQIAASLVAVFAVAWVVRAIGLGDDPRIDSVAHAIRLADEAHTGFGGIEAAIDRAGYGALVRNAAGQQMLVRPHGNHFAARMVDASVTARLDKDNLTLTPTDSWFGPVTLHLGKDSGRWASLMRQIQGGGVHG